MDMMNEMMKNKDKMLPMIEQVMDEMIETGECVLLNLIIDSPSLREKMAKMMMLACPTMINEIIPEEQLIDFKEMIDKEFVERLKAKQEE